MGLQQLRILSIGASALMLAACGGGGQRVASIAPPPTVVTPPPPPPPPPTTGPMAVDIFPSPASQEFATIGIGDALRIRYDAASNRYEVMAGARGWEALVDDPSFIRASDASARVFAYASCSHIA